jgi:hypothetical protein
MIRGAANKRLFRRNGERRKIGRLAKASFNVWKMVERYEPEGSRDPGGERRPEDRRGVSESDLATGFKRRTYLPKAVKSRATKSQGGREQEAERAERRFRNRFEDIGQER